MRTGGRTAAALAIAVGMIVSVGLLVSGCGASGADDNADLTVHPFVVGNQWLLESYSEPGGAETDIHAGTRAPYLKFKADHTVEVFDGCNTGGGDATVNDNGTIIFGPIRTTLLGCPEGTVEVSSAILKALQGTVDYSFDGPRLVISNGDQTLTYSTLTT